MSSCATDTFTHGPDTIKRTAIGVNLNVGVLDVTWSDGAKLRVEQLKSDQTQAIEAAIQGALKGAAMAVKP